MAHSLDAERSIFKDPAVAANPLIEADLHLAAQAPSRRRPAPLNPQDWPRPACPGFDTISATRGSPLLGGWPPKIGGCLLNVGGTDLISYRQRKLWKSSWEEFVNHPHRSLGQRLDRLMQLLPRAEKWTAEE